MPAKFFATRGHILLCQHTNCQNRGAALLYKALQGYLERESLAYYKAGGTVRLTASGCLGACRFGPVLCVYRQKPVAGLEEAWYAAVDFPLAKAVAQAVQNGTDLPHEQQYGPES